MWPEVDHGAGLSVPITRNRYVLAHVFGGDGGNDRIEPALPGRYGDMNAVADFPACRGRSVDRIGGYAPVNALIVERAVRDRDKASEATTIGRSVSPGD